MFQRDGRREIATMWVVVILLVRNWATLIADGLSAFGGALPLILMFLAVIFLAGKAVGGVFTYWAIRRKTKP